MTRHIYIHAFNSGSASPSGRLLTELTGMDIMLPEYDYSRPYAECMDFLQAELFRGLAEGDRTVLMGTSLGGFYALQLRHPSIIQVIAWNPVIFPVLQMRRFIGRNMRYTDGRFWDFTAETCLSYGAAPDPRPRTDVPERDIFLSLEDDVLEADAAEAFWAGHARVERIRAGHLVEDFSPMAGTILRHAASGIGDNPSPSLTREESGCRGTQAQAW